MLCGFLFLMTFCVDWIRRFDRVKLEKVARLSAWTATGDNNCYSEHKPPTASLLRASPVINPGTNVLHQPIFPYLPPFSS